MNNIIELANLNDLGRISIKINKLIEDHQVAVLGLPSNLAGLDTLRRWLKNNNIEIVTHDQNILTVNGKLVLSYCLEDAIISTLKAIAVVENL